MLNKRSRKITATGTFYCNLISIDDTVIEWIDTKEFNLADLAKTLGIDHEHKVRAIISLEIVEQPCEICGKMTTGDKLCDECGKLVCDQCAKITSHGNRYCPTCQIKI
jgi:RNA polymerase subunit RPABC4/transcription elongation factor Spt4